MQLDAKFDNIRMAQPSEIRADVQLSALTARARGSDRRSTAHSSTASSGRFGCVHLSVKMSTDAMTRCCPSMSCGFRSVNNNVPSVELTRQWSHESSGEYSTRKMLLTEENLALHDPTILVRQTPNEVSGFHDPKYLVLQTINSRHVYRPQIEKRIKTLKETILGDMQIA